MQPLTADLRSWLATMSARPTRASARIAQRMRLQLGLMTGGESNLATLNIIRTTECPAQNHVTIAVTGDVAHTYHGDMADFLAPMTNDEKNAFVKGLLRFAKIGRTNAQMRNALTNGVTVTV
jgi:hypothetical protein